MVEFTYQDYLKYEKLLRLEEQKRKENKFMKFTENDIERYAKILMQLEKLMQDDEYVYEKTPEEETDGIMVMEEDAPYSIERRQTRRKQKEA